MSRYACEDSLVIQDFMGTLLVIESFPFSVIIVSNRFGKVLGNFEYVTILVNFSCLL